MFLDVDASQASIIEVREALKDSQYVRIFSFLDKTQAYAEFQRLFADDPDLIAATRPADLPVSFRITLLDVSDATAFEAHLEELPAVNDVVMVDDERTSRSVRQASGRSRSAGRSRR